MHLYLYLAVPGGRRVRCMSLARRNLEFAWILSAVEEKCTTSPKLTQTFPQNNKLNTKV